MNLSHMRFVFFFNEAAKRLSPAEEDSVCGRSAGRAEDGERVSSKSSRRL